MHQFEIDRMNAEDQAYAEWESKHSEQLFREGMSAWIETLCEGHESLRGDMMGAETFCDGTCVPASQRREVDYLDYLEGLLPDD